MRRSVPRSPSVRRQVAFGLLAAALGFSAPSLACPTQETATAPAKRAVSAKSTTPAKSVARSTAAKSKAGVRRATVAPAKSAVVKSGAVISQAGLRIFRDPETGEIGAPTAAQAAEVAREDGAENLNFSSEGLQRVRHADGSISVDLEGRFQEYVVVRKDASGKVQKVCVQGAKAAKKALEGPAPAPAPVTEDR